MISEIVDYLKLNHKIVKGYFEFYKVYYGGKSQFEKSK